MFKIFFGCALLVIGVMVSMIPPFLWGIPVLMAASGMIWAGLGQLGFWAAKGAVKGAVALAEKSQKKDS